MKTNIPVPLTLSSFLLMLLLVSAAEAQDMHGYAFSNYAGIQGLKLNPGSAADTRLKWDVNIVSLDLYGMNDYLALPKNSINVLKIIDGSKPKDVTQEEIFNMRNKNGYVNLNVRLPSLMLTWKGKHTFAIHSTARSITNIEKMPWHIAKFFYEGVSYSPQHDTDYVANKFTITSLSWLEYGFTYSGVIHDKRRHFFAAGGTLNLLRGIGGFYFNNDYTRYRVPSTDSLVIYEATAQLAHAVPYSGTSKLFTGGGTGIDIGFEYQKKREYSWVSVYRRSLIKTYDYKIGLSIIDLGKITFRKGVGTAAVNGDSAMWLGISNEYIGAPNDIDTLINWNFYGTETGTGLGNSFKIGLPTTLVFQYDRNLNDYFYINAAVLLPLTKPGKSVARKQQIMLTPRWESKWTELQVPLSLYDGKKLHAGVVFRFNSIFIGSDYLLPLLGFGKIYGSSIYFGIKLSGFKERWSIKDKSSYLPSTKGIFSPFWRRRL